MIDNRLLHAVGDNHRRIGLMTRHARMLTIDHAVDELGQFLRQRVRARGFDRDVFDLNESFEDIFLQGFQIATGLRGQFQRRRAIQQRLTGGVTFHFALVHIDRHAT